MAVAARIITDGFFATVTTFGYMPTQGLCPAQGERPEGLSYLNRKVVLLFKLFPMKTDDLGYFILRLQRLAG